MESDPAVRTAEAARLLGELAAVPADDELLQACRRQAAEFAPGEAAADLLLDLLAPATDPEGLEESFAVLEEFLARLPAGDPEGTALRLLDGLARLEAAEADIESPRARRLREAMSAALRAGQAGAS